MSRANGHSLHRTASIASRMFPRGPFSRVSFQALALQNFVSYWLNGGSIIVISFLFLSTWLQQEYINSSYRCSLSTSAHDNFCHNCYKINVSCKLVMFFFFLCSIFYLFLLFHFAGNIITTIIRTYSKFLDLGRKLYFKELKIMTIRDMNVHSMQYIHTRNSKLYKCKRYVHTV